MNGPTSILPHGTGERENRPDLERESSLIRQRVTLPVSNDMPAGKTIFSWGVALLNRAEVAHRCPLLALFGHPTRTDECLLSGVKQT